MAKWKYLRPAIWVWFPSSVSLQGVKEEPAQSQEAKFLAKAGWVKKAHGKVLASYKDRYVHVGRTELVVYEHEVGYGTVVGGGRGVLGSAATCW